VSIRVPYKNLRKAELELVDVDESHHRIDLNSPSSHSSDYGAPNGSTNHAPAAAAAATPRGNISLMTLVLSCTVAAGVQFGWALQLSLLTPYIQVPTSLSQSFVCFAKFDVLKYGQST